MSANDAVGRPMEILLVEDSPVSARLTMGALRQGHVQHRMTWLTDGQEALEFVHQTGRFSKAPRPDLILLDLGLPGRDGREVLAELKADDGYQRIPVVVLTASTATEDVDAAGKLSVEGYMTKPVDMEQFLNLIRELKNFWHAEVILPTAE
jgi:chemotaxis family two-component system response regulator Rcp1